MNKAELKNYVVNKLLKKYARQYKNDPAWAWARIKAEVQATTGAEKKEIIEALENTAMVRRFINAEASSEADAMLADDSLDLNELTRILEDT